MTLPTVIGIDPATESDGAIILRMKDSNGQDTSAVIPVTMVDVILSALQRISIDRVFSAAKGGELTPGVTLPNLTIEEVNTADGGSVTTLCGRISQVGWVLLGAPDDVLRQMKKKIDEVLSSSRIKH
jgi:hypothetical protein